MIHEKAQAVAPNIKYEFSMLEWTCKEVFKHAENSQDRNGHLECFLLHARNLLDFFVKPKSYRKKSDVIVRDFFKDGSIWESKEKKLLHYTLNERDEIHKTLAHLTFERIEQKIWDVCRISSELNQAKSEFLGTLDSAQRSWFN